MTLIYEHGPSNWVRISQMLESRTPKQCRERYHQNLKPSLNHSPITDEEGAYIEQLVAQYGKKWAEIARHLTGRSDNAVKNWWNGGANRRRRASLQVTSPMDQSPSGGGYDHPAHPTHPTHQQNGTPVFGNPFSGHSQHVTPPPPTLPSTTNYYNSSYPPPPPPPPSSNSTQIPSQFANSSYHSIGHRVSLPNIYSDSFVSMRPGTNSNSNSNSTTNNSSPFASPQYSGIPSSRKPSGIVFNSAYTSDSSGFRKSSTVAASSTVDPHQPSTHHQDSPIPTDPSLPGINQPSLLGGGPLVGNKVRSHRRAGSLHHGSSASPFQRRRAHLGDDDPLAPFARRFSATTTTTSGTHRSSRANSISGLSSASDNEEPVMPPSAYSLSRYSLSNSTSSSRRSSHVIPVPPISDPTVLPPLTSNGSTPITTTSTNNTTASSTSPSSTQPTIVFNSNYASASPSPSFNPVSAPYEHRQSISSVNSLLQQSHLQSQRPSISVPSSSSSVSSTNEEPSISNSTTTLKEPSGNAANREPKLKISNLLS